MSEPEREPTIERERRLHEVLGAFFEAVEAGQSPDPQDLIELHPDLAEDLAAFFADEGRFRRLIGPLHSTAGSGPVAADQTATAAFSADPAPPAPNPDATAQPPGSGRGPDPALAKGTRIRYFGDYELKLILGRGGMGVVYKAKQLSLNRLVALKMIRAGLWAGDDEVRRFKNEAEAVANLDHPRIVTIHEVGQYEGHHYFSMRLVEGPSLEKVLDQYVADPRKAARLVSEVARAVHHAHQRGILHRDLKPSNILLDGDGHPHVTDFGLAKRLEGNGALSISGSIAGTPQYMSPEQASGSRQGITTATDIYGLGALLYAAITGQPPFQSDSVLETLEQVRETTPTPPSKINRRVPRDLEVICLKGLEKDPRRRYGSADALADDLERYLRGEPILARRTSIPERVVKWTKRRPAVAALLMVVLVTALGGLAGIFWQWQRAEDQRDRAVVARNDAIEARKVAETRRLEAQRKATRLALDRGLALCQQGEVGQGMLWLARTLELAPTEAADLVRVARTNLSGWLRRLAPLQAILQHGGEVAALSPDRTRLLTGRSSSDGKTGEFQLWDVATRQPMGPPLKHGASVIGLGFSPDGATLLTRAGEQHRLWDAATGTPKGDVIPIPSRHFLSGSPDGKVIASTDPADLKTMRLYDGATGKPFGRPLTHKGEVGLSAFSPDGNVLLIASRDGSAQFWDARTGAPKGEPLWRDVPFGIASLEFSPDGQTLLAQDFLALGGVTRFRLWDLTQGKVIGPAVQPHGVVPAFTVTWSRDNKSLLTASWDRTARLWDAATGKLRIPSLPHHAPVHLGRFSPDEKMILTASHDTTARLWDTATGEPVSPYLRHPDRVQDAWFTPDGRTILTSSRDGTLRTWGIPAGQPMGSSLLHSNAVFRLDLADHDTVLTSSVDKLDGALGPEVRLWDVTTRQPLGPPLGTAPNLFAWLSPDGRTVLTGRSMYDEPVQLWDVATGRPRGEPIPIGGTLCGACFHPLSTTFVVCVERRTPSGLICEGRLWDVASGRPLGTLFTFPSKNWDVNLAFSPDGQTILVQEAQGAARLWDCATHQPLGPFIKQNGAIRSMAFHPDGKTVLTGGDDSVARLWNVATGRRLDELPFDTPGWTDYVAFSPDGRIFLTSTFDRTTWSGVREESSRPPAGATRLWDTATRLPLGAPFDQGGAWSAAFSRDGTMIVIGCLDGQVRFWRVPMPVAGDAEQMTLWVQVSTGLELTSDGGVQILDAETWQARRRRLEELGGPPRL